MGSHGVVRGSETATREASSGGAGDTCSSGYASGHTTCFFPSPSGRRWKLASPLRLSLAPRWGQSQIACPLPGSRVGAHSLDSGSADHHMGGPVCIQSLRPGCG